MDRTQAAMHQWVTLTLLLVVVGTSLVEAGEPWEDMDYGPYLSASVAAWPRENIAYKGVAIPLSTGGDEPEEVTVLFDTNLLRFAAGWTGGFLELRGIVFDRAHGTFPRADGTPWWHNPMGPGWALDGEYDDPRDLPYAPLPPTSARWRGLYLHGDNVILSYSIGKSAILDHPAVERRGATWALARTLQVGPEDGPRGARVCRVESAEAGGLDLRDLSASSLERPARDVVCVLSPKGAGTGRTRTVAVALRDPGGACRWDTADPGEIRLRIPSAADTTRVTLLLYAAETPGDEGLASFAELVRSGPPPRDLSMWTRGGPRRWGETLKTRGRIDRVGVTEEVALVVPTGSGMASLPLGSDGEREARVVSVESLVESAEPGPADSSVALLATPPEDPSARERRLEAYRSKLIGRWEFEEGVGDFSANQEGPAGPVLFDDARWRRGVEGRALELEGTGSATISKASSASFESSDLTVSVWIQTSSDGSILAKTAAEGPWVPGGKALFVRDGQLGFDVGWVGFVGTDRKIDDGRWHHVALTWHHESSEVRLYVDGRAAGEGTLRSDEETDTRGHVVRLGHTSSDFPQGATRFNGKMDGLRLYSTALPPERIADLARQGSPRSMTAWALAERAPGARWIPSGHTVSLEVPRSNEPSTVRLLRWSGSSSEMQSFLRQVGPGASRHSHPFAIDELTAPDDNPWRSWMRFGGFDFFSDGDRAAICTWSGDVWVVTGIRGDLSSLEWQRIATGLHQPLGLRIVKDQIHVIDRNQLTRLVDSNGDGETDFYESLNSSIMNSEHFHEPCMELQTDGSGNFYTMKGARHALRALHPFHGTLVKISPDGSETSIVAGGFRASNGFALGPGGALYGSDQEGHWMPANRINRVRPGEFHGNQWAWLPSGPRDDYVPPLCWLHPRVDRSPSSFVWVGSNTWKPIEQHLLSLSYGRGQVFLVLEEVVDGVAQGGVTPLPMEFPTGVMRARFHPEDGHLYACGLVGWSSDRSREGGWFRVRYTGSPLRVPVELRAARNGLVLRFSSPLDRESAADPSSYEIRAWNYRWTERYGSPDYDLEGREGRSRMEVRDVVVSGDSRSLFLEIPELRPVMQIQIDFRLRSPDGAPLRSFIHHTIHRLGREVGRSLVH